MKIAVSGKGGVGKTSVSSTLAKLYASEGYQVFAVDADPDTSLGLALGIDEEELAKILPIIAMEDAIREKSGGGAFYSLNPQVDDILDQYSVMLGNIRFLRMGGIKQGGSACYCRENVFLHSMVDSLILDKDEVVILDMGAGIEHLTRGTSQGVDVMLIVTEPTRTSVQTAKVVQKLAQDLGIQNIRFIGNKIRNHKEEAFLQEQFTGQELLGMIPYDDGILDSALEGASSAVPAGRFGDTLREMYGQIVKEFKK